MHELLGARVHKAQGAGVQGVAGHDLKAVIYKLFVLIEDGALQDAVAPVGIIIEEGVADVLHAVDSKAADLVVLDGESAPTGGIGISRQMFQELDDVPPIALVVGRTADRWLATWAKADEILVHPLDPVTTAEAIATLLRRRSAGLPTVAELAHAAPHRF